MEAEVIIGGESGLQTYFNKCIKNPGHQNFIPVNEFSLDHLPAEYKDQDLLDCVQAVSALTCRLSVKGVSQNRPDTFPGSNTLYPFSADARRNTIIVGTGYIHTIYVFKSGETCPCKVCMTADSPVKQYVEMYILTAAHVVFDQYEAERTTCHFFFDQGISPRACPSVVSLPVDKLDSSRTLQDTAYLVVYTHDIILGELFRSMQEKRIPLVNKVLAKFMNTDVSFQTKHTRFRKSFILSFNENSDSLRKAIMSVCLKRDIVAPCDITIVPFCDIETFETFLKNSQIERLEDRNYKLLLLENMKAELMSVSCCFEGNQQVSIPIRDKLASEKKRINSTWQDAEDEIICFFSVIQREIGEVALDYMKNSPVSNEVFKKIRMLIEIKEELIQSLLKDLVVFAALLKEDFLVLKKIVDYRNTSREICEDLTQEIDDLQFSITETRAVLMSRHKLNETNVSTPSNCWNDKQRSLMKEIELCFLRSCAVYQPQCKEEFSPVGSSSAKRPSLLMELVKLEKAIFHIKRLFLMIMLQVRESICSYFHELTVITGSNTFTKTEEKSNVIKETISCIHHNKEIGASESHPAEESSENMVENNKPLVIMVSHPHGASKHVTVGYLDFETDMDFGIDHLSHKFEFTAGQVMRSYSTPSCPGSSGAPVLVFTSSGSSRHGYPFTQPYPFCTHSGCCGQLNHSTFSAFPW